MAAHIRQVDRMPWIPDNFICNDDTLVELSLLEQDADTQRCLYAVSGAATAIQRARYDALAVCIDTPVYCARAAAIATKLRADARLPPYPHQL